MATENLVENFEKIQKVIIFHVCNKLTYQESIAKSRVNDHQKHKAAHFAERRFSHFEPFFDELAQNLAANEWDYDGHRKLRENGAKTHRCRLAHECQKQKWCRDDSLNFLSSKMLLKISKFQRNFLKIYNFLLYFSIITKNEPKAELKIAAASFPPTAFVKMTADETGGGMQETTVSPESSHGSSGVTFAKTLLKKYMKTGTKRSVKDLN